MVGKERLKRRMQGCYDPIPDIDAAVLRTCRKAYNEAMGTLYGENTFKLSSIRALNANEDGLTKRGGISLPMHITGTAANKGHPGMNFFGFPPSPTGRLSLIRHLCLCIAVDSAMVFLTHSFDPSRNELCRDWVEFLDPSGYWRWLKIPTLHTLGLDFSDWRLGPSEALFVSFII